MRLIILHLIFLLFVLASCNPSPKKSILESNCDIISIERAFDKKSKVHLSDYFSALDYIPLETAPECMLDGANSLDIRVCGDRIYLYNSNYFLDTILQSVLKGIGNGRRSLYMGENALLHLDEFARRAYAAPYMRRRKV